jgi:hypothetical protein
VKNKTKSIIYKYNGNDFDKIKEKNHNVKVKNKYLKKYSYYKKNLLFFKYFINNNKFNFIYVRRPFLSYKFIKIIKKFSKYSYIFYEYPTYPHLKESFNTKNFPKLVTDLIYERFLKKYIYNYIVISYYNSNERFITINNGIDLANIKTVKKEVKNNKLNLLVIANLAPWHGIDRIIKGLYNYYSIKSNSDKKDIKLFIIGYGNGKIYNSLVKLTKELNMEKYVIFHGTKTGKELDDIVNKCDMAFGSLGMHRIDLEYASTLKLREYCARGIPFVYAYNDFDFNNFKYSMKIDSNESPVNIDKIIEFYNSIKNENYIEEMRKYAEENLTWDAKMKPVIEKINELIKERNFDK